MKLIFFVAISFLATTVSAWLPSSPPYHNLQQLDQDEVQVELARLTTDYENERAIIFPIEGRVKIKRQKVVASKNKVDSIVAKLKETNLRDDERSKLDQQYDVAKVERDALSAEYNQYYLNYITIRQKRDDARTTLDLLVENQALIADYNAKNVIQTRPSPNSVYHIGFLKNQIGHILKKIENLFKEFEDIKTDKTLSKDDLRHQSAEIKDKIRRYENQRETAEKIFQNYERSLPIGVRIMQFFYSYLPNA
ncbi:hypothetical protein BASA50_000906 [Batrachochytrium salamandrivorans]|uniref:Uncharacterized protein n=1 Tax=Batrachochytrium salamandrivorans TaxID=1357716 RepID=A0ABQ8ESN2_9FUNG|nr:hypothetical protein BASA50_000906 [Batrachochytrium salamandrivorans]KAH9275751.1 hypothetical protein BASA83_001552 [Batrachochytrium salamandrivorans]